LAIKKSQGPMLFVNQSFLRPPSNLNMQEVYTNRQELAPFEDAPPMLEETKKTNPIAKEEIVLEKKVKSKEPEVDSESNQKGKHRHSLKRVKPFKEMDLLERLDYLTNFPKVLPPVPCVFYTTQGNYQGYLTEYTDQYVTLQFHDQTSKTLPLEQLTNIIMIGLKR